MWFNKHRTSITIGPRDIRLLATNSKGVWQWKGQDIPASWIQGGRIVEQQQVAAVIESLLKSLPHIGDELRICISGLTFIQRTLTLPGMKPSMVDDAVRYQLRNDPSLPLDQMKISWRVTGEDNDEFTFGVIGIDAAILASIESAIGMAGIRHWSLELQSFALRRLLPVSNAILLNLEKDSFELCRFIDGEATTVYTVQLDEHISTVHDYVEQVLSVVTKALHRRNEPESMLPVFLTGVSADELHLKQAIDEELGYESRHLEPAEPVPPEFPFHQYATNLGLLTSSKGNAHHPKNMAPTIYGHVDLLAGRYRRQPVSLSVIPWVIILTMFAVIGHALPIYAGMNANENTLQQLQNEYRAASLQLVQAQETASVRSELENEFDSLLLQTQRLKDDIHELLGAPGELTGHLLGIVDALPASCRFQMITVSEESIVLRVNSESLEDLFSYADTLNLLDPSYLVRIAVIEEIFEKPVDTGMFEFEVIVRK